MTTIMLNQSVEKAIRLLSRLSMHPNGATASTLAAETGIPRPTAFRLLRTLEQASLLDKVENHYFPGWYLAELARLADRTRGIVIRSAPLLSRLALEIEESVQLSIRNDHNHTVPVIAQATGPRVLQYEAVIGSTHPLHASANGKLLLADLDQPWPIDSLERYTSTTITSYSALTAEIDRVKKQGYALSFEELEDGLTAVSVPICDPNGRLLLCLSMTGPKYRWSVAALEAVVPALAAAASEVESILFGENTPALEAGLELASRTLLTR
jgi:DNA-binding IclR family transcriptional regulator